MQHHSVLPRRGFLSRMVAASTALGLPLAGGRGVAEAAQPGAGDWIKEVRGTHRCFFDCPQHLNGFGLVHILNYLGTYQSAYKSAPGEVGAVSSFYGIGAASSIALGFGDAAWAKYGLGEYLGLKDANGRPYTRNVFFSPSPADGHLLAQRVQAPNLPMMGEAIVGAGIANLQKMGTKFLMCNNALQLWTLELEARGKGAAADIDKDLRANLLPGVTMVPAMVIAIEEAQAAGIRYNRQ
jgi:intracellular sulfur oxidation DsrE/DsrF family protein